MRLARSSYTKSKSIAFLHVSNEKQHAKLRTAKGMGGG